MLWPQRQAEFLATMANRGPFDLATGTIVVIPSLTLPFDELKDIVGVQFYEERLLFLLLLLRRPGVRIVFVTSTEIAPEIIDYYLGFVSDPVSAKERLTLVTLNDSRAMTLTAKILQDEESIARIADAIRPAENVYLMPFNVTKHEETLASHLGIPIYGPPSELASLGGKSGGRLVAMAAGVPVVDGVEHVRDQTDVERAFASLCQHDRDRAVLKLNDSFSGMGNVILSRKNDGEAIPVADELWATLPKGVTSWGDYLGRLAARGGAIELLIAGPITAPSVQLLIKPGKRIEIISTHDQVLGGIAKQIYLGCEFPAHEAYRIAIVEHARRIGSALADRGVVGVLAIDFLVALQHNRIYFGEINLRLGGTTHPFGMSRWATESELDQESGLLMSRLGPRYYLASDNVEDDSLVGKSPSTVLKALHEAGILFDPRRLTGVTLHQMGSLHESGKLGVCAIAASSDDAKTVFQDALNAFSQV
jgi:hypothetical protein